MNKTDSKLKMPDTNQKYEIQWGREAKLDSKQYFVRDLIIENRFDFGGDADILVRNTKRVPPQYKKSLFAFKNFIKKPKNDKNI